MHSQVSVESENGLPAETFPIVQTDIKTTFCRFGILLVISEFIIRSAQIHESQLQSHRKAMRGFFFHHLIGSTQHESESFEIACHSIIADQETSHAEFLIIV